MSVFPFFRRGRLSVQDHTGIFDRKFFAFMSHGEPVDIQSYRADVTAASKNPHFAVF